MCQKHSNIILLQNCTIDYWSGILLDILQCNGDSQSHSIEFGQISMLCMQIFFARHKETPLHCVLVSASQ